MRRSAIAFLCLTGWVANAQVTATGPATTESIRPAADFATQTFQDPWDMSQRTDLGWFTFSVDQPSVNLTNPTVSGGVFSATSANNDPNFWLLNTGQPNAAPFGKNGESFPINASTYKRLLLRMNISGGGLTSVAPGSMQVLWSNNTLYQAGGPSVSPGIFVRPGWWVYSIDLTNAASAGANWAGTVDSLRVDPVATAGVAFDVDWARLVSDDPALSRNITWMGGGSVDIYLDNDADFGNGHLGQIAVGAAGGSFSFYVGGLPPGTYRVALRPTGSSSTPSYAPGSWVVEDTPTVSFTSPSPIGSTQDFATVVLGNAWDMDTLADADRLDDVTGQVITNITAENEAGASLGSVRVLRGTSVQAYQAPLDVGDPRVYTLFWTQRGAANSIDTSRYRILDLDMGIEGARDINLGSIARIVWRVKGEGGENVSDDIILNHLAGANVLQKINLDMKTLPLDAGPSSSGWTGMVDGFRVDPHEFPSPRTFFIKSVYLRAFERADASYAVRWNYATANTSGSPSVTLFYDTDKAGFNGTQIAAVANPATGEYTWNTSAMPAGTYYIYAVVSAGADTLNRAYAEWPVVIEHGGGGGGSATLAVSRTNVPFGAVAGSTTQITGAQDVQISFTGSGAGSANWSASSNQTWLRVSPVAGTGSAKLTLSLNAAALPGAGTHTATVTVTSTGATGSPRTITVPLTVRAAASTAVPFGVLDEPSATRPAKPYGAIGVTGWALDDTEVVSVSIWRNPIGAEPRHPNGHVYIGEGIFLEGARPDIGVAYPAYPMGTRAGWGMQVLTNMLPNSNGQPGTGNGNYTLYAYATDREGKTALLGSAAITVSNATATLPFGTLDTPLNGQEVSGTVTVFGWALTPQPATIPTDGSSMWVFVDGVSLGHPTYGQFRPDIAGLFPGYNNTNGAVGYYHLNTTQLADGLHSIAWSVTDNLGRTEGIGSRLFRVRNSVGGADAPEAAGATLSEAKSTRQAARRDGSFSYRSGWDPAAELRRLDTGEVEVEQGGRIELHVPAGVVSVTFDGSDSLPPGSTFNAEAGVFYWHVPAGFRGVFELAFHSAGSVEPHTVRVKTGGGGE